MGLNIKKPSTEAAIRELAALTGESLTDAVESAVRDKLAQIETKKPKPRETLEEMLAWVKVLQDSLAAKKINPDDKRTARELIDELYDENGLPI
ncbi:MAG TPA: type II toxin-antitoxin system VapB family antitoxin [Rhizomicrobium sp.]|nr:type II toxin-antitoxin system VapB family antitoxin [Rhizomicrobium sp.]